MEILNIHVPGVGIEALKIPHIFTRQVQVEHAVSPSVPVTVDIGKPIVDIPGCVEVHPENKYPDGTKNKQLAKDDDTVTFCDAGMPSFDAMDYTPEQLTITREVPPPPVEPPPEPPTSPEVKPPTIPEGETECPAPNQPRVGDLTQKGTEKVIGHELKDGVCIVLYEDTSIVEKILPSTNQVTTTAAIAVVATAAAAATPLLLRVIKPVIKKVFTSVKKALGKNKKKDKLTSDQILKKNGMKKLRITD